MIYVQTTELDGGRESNERRLPRDVISLPITTRQLECLAWASEGKTASEIGIILGISTRTVEWHLANVCRVLGVRTRIQAAIKAHKLGWLPLRIGKPAGVSP